MKRIIVLFYIVLILGCSEDNQNSDPIFDPAELSKLDLGSITNFWGNDSIKQILDFTDGAIFNTHQKYLGGVTYHGEMRSVLVTVFSSQKASIEAMEQRIDNVAEIIRKGYGDDRIEENWWFVDGISDAIFLNKFNTIIEIEYNVYPTYAENKTVMIDAVNEVSKRIESLSNLE